MHACAASKQACGHGAAWRDSTRYETATHAGGLGVLEGAVQRDLLVVAHDVQRLCVCVVTSVVGVWLCVGVMDCLSCSSAS